MRFLSNRRKSSPIKLSHVLLVSTLSLLALYPPVYGDETPDFLLAPTPIIYSGHKNVVEDVDFSPDGKRLVSISSDGIRVWDLESGAILHDIRSDIGPANALKLLEDGHTVLAAFPNSALTRVDLETGIEKIIAAPPPGRVSVRYGHTVWSPDAQTAFSEVDHSFIEVRSTQSGQRLETLTPSQLLIPQSFPELTRPVPDKYPGSQALAAQFQLECIAISPDGRYLAMSGGLSRRIAPPRQDSFLENFNSPVFLWDIKGHKLARTFRTGPKPVLAVVFSRDGSLLAAANEEPNVDGQAKGTVHLWNVQTGEARPNIVAGNQVPRALEFSQDNQWLAATSFEGDIWARNLHTGETLPNFQRKLPRALVLRASPDGNNWVTAHLDGTLLVHSRVPYLSTRKLYRDAGPDIPMAVSPDGRWLVTARGSALHIWDLEQATLLRTSRVAFGDAWDMVAVTRDANFAVVAREQNSLASASTKLELWHLDTGIRFPLRDLQGKIAGLAISPDATSVAVAYYRQYVGLLHTAPGESTLSVLNISNGRVLWEQKEPIKAGSIAFSPDGLTLASVCYEPTSDTHVWSGNASRIFNAPSGSVRLWDTKTGALQKEVAKQTGFVSTLSFSSDSKRLLTLAGGQPRIWSIEQGTLLDVMPKFANQAEILPNGQIAVQADKPHIGENGIANYQNATAECQYWDTSPFSRISLHTSLSTLMKPHRDKPLLPFIFRDSKIFASSSTEGVLINNYHSPVTFLTRESNTRQHETDWLIYDEAGHYTGSPGIEKFMHWKQRGQLLKKAPTDMARPKIVRDRLNWKLVEPNKSGQ